MIVRNLRPGENWPDGLGMGFEGDCLNRDWCWVVEGDNGVEAGLLTCPMHGAIFLLRLAAKAGASELAVHALLKGTLMGAKARGCTGYTTLLDPTTEEGRKMMKIVRRAGGTEWPRPTILAFGLISTVKGI